MDMSRAGSAAFQRLAQSLGCPAEASTLPSFELVFDDELPVTVTLPAGPAPFEVRDENRVSIDTSDIIRWNGNAVDLAELGQLVKAASERAVPATLLFEPDAQARYLRVDQAIGAIRRNGGSKIAFPGIQRYGGLV